MTKISQMWNKRDNKFIHIKMNRLFQSKLSPSYLRIAMTQLPKIRIVRLN